MRISTPKLAAPGSEDPVTMLELFFDLVFVFLVTQVTSLITQSEGWGGYAQAALVLAVTWWMYDGYAWLANNVGPTTTGTRLPMLVAMAAFLLMAIAVPDAFGSAAWVFAAAYLAVVTIHIVQFSRSSLGDSARAIRGLVPVNFGVAALLVAAAVAGPSLGWLCWVGAVIVLLGAVLSRRESSFTLRADHFAERHQLLVIIALGETVVATGASSQGQITHLDVLAAMGLSMVLISGLWWVYFGTGDETRALTAISAASASRRALLANRGYAVTHLVHIAGLVLVAAGLHQVIHQPGHRLPWRWALTLAGGAAVFLAGQGLFRRALEAGPARPYAVGALALLVLSPLGPLVSGLALLAATGAGVVLSLSVVLSLQCRAGAPRGARV